jgi:dTDP-glucose pyrophosphorylase
MEEGTERPRAVSEYLIERMIHAGATKLCFVISPAKTDILQYYGARLWGADIAYVVQSQPGGLCDALFRSIPLIHPDEEVLIGLPDTVWTPKEGLALLPEDQFSFLLFPVERPELFDAVLTREDGSVVEVQVKRQGADSNWIWGAVKMPGRVFHQLHQLWSRPERRDEFLGTLVNAWLAEGGRAYGVKAGQNYVDTGTLHGYRAAIHLLQELPTEETNAAA